MNKHNPSEKIVIVKEELDGSNIDDIGNLENLLKIVSIHKECGNLKVFVDGRELTGNINNKNESGVLQKIAFLQYECGIS